MQLGRVISDLKSLFKLNFLFFIYSLKLVGEIFHENPLMQLYLIFQRNKKNINMYKTNNFLFIVILVFLVYTFFYTGDML